MARIKNPITIVGTAGGSGKPEEAKTVTLALSSGDQVVQPSEGCTISQVTIQKPATLLASNIKSGVNIAGVIGSLVISNTLPTLYTPSISKSSNTLNISNSSNNGAYVAGYKIYSDGTLINTQSGTSYTITNLSKGRYNLSVKAYGTNFNDSNLTSALAVAVYEFLKDIKNVTISATLSKTTSGLTVSFTIAAASGYYRPTKISVYCNGEELAYTYNPYTGAVAISALKTDYSGTDTRLLTSPTLSLSGSVLTIDDTKFATAVDVYDGSTNVSEVSVTPSVSDTTNVIVICAEGLTSPKLVTPAVTLDGSTITIVDSAIGSGEVTNATAYDVYDGNTVATTITL